jgi:hypothetical protein
MKVKLDAIERNIYCESRSDALRLVVQVSPLPKSSATFDIDQYDQGLNLQHGGRNICVFSHALDLELFQQVRERVGPVRQLQAGYDRVVHEYYILVRDTVDELCMKRLEGQAITQDEVMAWRNHTSTSRR